MVTSDGYRLKMIAVLNKNDYIVLVIGYKWLKVMVYCGYRWKMITSSII